MVDKVTAADIQNLVTDGASAARLVNDEKRAINQLIDRDNTFGSVVTRNTGTGNTDVPLNSNLATVGRTGRSEDLVTRDVLPVDTVADLRLLTSLSDGQVIYLKGYNSVGDGGGGELTVVGDQSTEVDDTYKTFIVDGKVLRKSFTTLSLFDFGLRGDKTDESARMLVAATSGETITVPKVPGGFFSFQGVRRSRNTNFVGLSKSIYTPSLSEMEGQSAFVLASGGTSFWIPDTNETRVRQIEDTNLMYWGQGGTSELATELQRYNATGCGFYNMFAGMGINGYARECQYVNCNSNQNSYGIRNLIDSKIFGGYVNVNSLGGVSQQAGANDSDFTSVKVEFNGGRGYDFFQSTSCSINGGIVDRSSSDGLRAGAGSEITVNGTIFRRNAASGTGYHINNEGCDSLNLNAIKTRTGNTNDDGTGTIVPVQSLRVNGGDYANISDSDLTGGTGSDVLDLVSLPTRYNIVDNEGVENLIKTDTTELSRNRLATNKVNTPTITASGGTHTFTVNQVPISTFTRQLLSINVIARFTTNAVTFSGEARCSISREAGNTSITYVGNSFESGANRLGDQATDSCQISFGNIAADGSSYDITITNNASAPFVAWIDVI